MKTILSAAIGCLFANVAFAAIDTHVTPSVSPSPTVTAVGAPAAAVPVLLLARNGADDPGGHVRQGRGRDDVVIHNRRGADNAPGDLRQGRGADDPVGHKRNGADNPAGDLRRHGRDDLPNHG